MKVEQKLTSVHIIDNIYKNFKINSIESNINLQKLVNRCIHLYNTDAEFKEKINNHTALAVNGSKY
jgi:hypothetical protein